MKWLIALALLATPSTATAQHLTDEIRDVGVHVCAEIASAQLGKAHIIRGSTWPEGGWTEHGSQTLRNTTTAVHFTVAAGPRQFIYCLMGWPEMPDRETLIPRPRVYEASIDTKDGYIVLDKIDMQLINMSIDTYLPK